MNGYCHLNRAGLHLTIIGKGGRVAEGARLESVFTGNCNVGSNPTLSANLHQNLALSAFIFRSLTHSLEVNFAQ